MAKIDSLEITAADLLRFKADMPVLLRSDKEGVEELDDEYLQNLIDLELLYLEAVARGIDRDSEFIERWESEYARKLTAEYLKREIKHELNLPEEELRRRWAQSKWRRVLKLARIRVESESEARQILWELEKSADFGDLARIHSTDTATSAKGGALGLWLGRLTIDKLAMIGRTKGDLQQSLEIAETTFELPVGGVSGPFQAHEGYELYKVMEEMPAPLEYFVVFAQMHHSMAVSDIRDKLYAELAARFEAEPQAQAIALLAQRAAESPDAFPRLSEADEEEAICRFRGGEITLKDFMELYAGTARSIELDSTGVARVLDRYVLPELLVSRAAREDGLAQDSSMVAWVAATRRALIIETLRAREVDERLDLNNAAIRRYYDEHPSQFKQPDEIEVLEILTETEDEAAKLLERIRTGEDMAELAVQYSIRVDAAANKGRFHMHPFEVAHFGALLRAASEAPPGVVQGPVELRDVGHGEEGYSIFKVVGRTEGPPKPFEKVRKQSRYWLSKVEEKRLGEELTRRLRQKYGSSIVVYREQLKRMSEIPSM